MNRTKIAYFGNDERFFKNVLDTLSHNVETLFETQIYNIKAKTRSQLDQMVFQSRGNKIVYIDFTYPESMARYIARKIKNDQEMKGVIVVGLFGSEQEDLKVWSECNNYTQLNFTKSVEVEDVLSHPVQLMNPQFRISQKYAETDTQKMVPGNVNITVLSINSEVVTFETELDLPLGEKYQIDGALFEKKSPYVAIYVEKKFNYHFCENEKFRYIGRLSYSKDSQKKSEDTVESIKHNLTKFYKKEFSRTPQKRLRILEVDRNQTIFFENQDYDYPCEYLSIQNISDIEKDVLGRMPHEIHLSYEEGKSTYKNYVNNLGLVMELCDLFKENDIRPRIVLWNFDAIAVEKIRALFDYDHIMVMDEKITSKMFYEYTSKRSKEVFKTREKNNFYIDHLSRFRYASISINIFITKVNESFCAIATKERIAHQVNIRCFIDGSQDQISLLVCPYLGNAYGINGTYKHQYKCFIHSTDEERKKALRVAVNAAIKDKSLLLKGSGRADVMIA